MSSTEYFFNDYFIIDANTNIYAQNLNPVYNTNYDYILTFPGQLANYFSIKTYQQEGPAITYVPIDSSVSSYLGSNRIGATNHGSDVYLSKDGLVMAVGGRADNSNAGAVWIWTRNGTVWTEAAKLVGTGATGAAQQGISVALSNDGSTVAVGGPKNNSDVGAVWIFQKSAGVWSQQQLLTPSNNTGGSNFGSDVALSGDGNTLVVGGRYDNSNTGAVWVFTRSSGTWTQQQKISANASGANQGTSVAITEDGTKLVFGGPRDSNDNGAVWVYSLSAGTWSLDTKIVGTLNDSTAVTGAFQGKTVQISGNGTTIAFGGPSYNSNQGAVWVWIYSNNTWTQQIMISNTDYNILGISPRQGYALTLSTDGNKLVFTTDNRYGTGSIWVYSRAGSSWSENDWLIYSGNYGDSRESMMVSMSGDGYLLVVSAPNDANYVGAVWSYINSGVSIITNSSNNILTNQVDVALVFNTDYYNGVSATTGYNNIGILGGKTTVQSLGMQGLENGLDFGTRVLEILAIKIFGHARARSAISNDTTITSNIKENLSNHFINVINKYKYSIFNQYVQTDNPNINTDDITAPVEFNFQQDILSFPGFIVGNLDDKSRLSNDLLAGPNVGGNLMVNGEYNIPILIRVGNI